MIDALVIFGYLVVAALFARRVAWLVVHDNTTTYYSAREPGGDDYMEAAIVGFALGVVWPITLPGYLLIQHRPRWLLSPPPSEREREEIRRREREVAVREAHIAELEREVGIG